MLKTLENIEKYLSYILIVLLPVFVLSSFTSLAVLPKEIFLVAGVSLMLLLWATRMMIGGNMSFSFGKFDLAVGAIALSFLISSFIKTPNKMEAFFFPGVTTFVLAGALLYFLINQFENKAKENLTYSLIISGLLLAISILFTQIGLFDKVPQLPAFVKDPNFNPLGGSLPSVIFLAGILPFLAGAIVKQKDLALKLFISVSALIIVAGLGLSVKNILSGGSQALRLPDTKTSWEIAVESLKVSPFLGIGPGNYLSAFNKFRPLAFNGTDLWPVKFATGSNFYLTAISELGFTGVFAFGLLFIAVYRYLRKNLKLDNLESLSIPLMLISFAILPGVPVLIVSLFILLSLFSESEQRSVGKETTTAHVPSILAGIPLIIGVLVLAFFGYRTVSGEHKFKLALDAVAKNEAKPAYDNVQAAIALNPRVDRYRASFAQINMALANSLASKQDLTDTDRNTISQLIQSAIAEAKATVALNLDRSGNWEVLAQIYRSIMPYASGADNFAVETFSRAVALDPINPNLRISLGGTYYALGRYDEAIEAFKLAVLAKPDLANAHYNLAVAYREKKDYTKATEEMNTVLSLVGKDSADYETALKELKNIEDLTPPEAKEESNITPPIELPEDSTPPQP